MIEAFTAAQVRAAEEPLLAHGVPLMERAAFALATVVAQDLRRGARGRTPDGAERPRRVTGRRVVLLVGSGNNGGDALFAGAYLARRGVAVEAVCTSEHPHAEGLAALRRAGGRVIDLAAGRPSWSPVVDTVLAAHAVVDGLVGIGATGALRGVAGELVAALAGKRSLRSRGGSGSGAGPWVVAVDVPSGIGVDDGSVPGPVLRADRTVTFGALKPGLLLPPATRLAGAVTLVDVGLEEVGGAAGPRVRRLERADVARLWPVPGPTDQKYTRGVLGVVAGTPTFPGAAVLAVTAAVRAGAGMVRYRGPDDVAHVVVSARPEAVPAEGRVQAWALGSGIPAAEERATAREGGGDEGGGRSADAGQHERIRYALAVACGLLSEDVTGPRVPAVVDAGALSLLPDRCPPSVVLTPHAGELATLLSARGEDVEREEVEAEPLRWARRAHDLTGATVLLKGAATVVVGPDGAWSQADGPSWLATAGAGDVLTGLLGALLAAYGERVVQEPWLAAELAAAAATVHGWAGARANPGGPVAALDVAEALPGVVANLLREGDGRTRRG
ncbi:bifunctional ADP-dependent NAD(P)H-hydrate dehydratase/NAD(P)H-hydrate epimerase [Oerskovia sp. KBS0722]|uniref:bifunctional ADP-dependent NAD(P)H-hydrate dehydratase/NAD(P)H-hydrate epimerase n=1 Tax=Oerskovia sp. KBS0722 TaxID=1179673 RepID=UPI00110EC1AA|nr:bifunctional ADP-dependent NAD(P)H-hydrate dehydratase/NAD(P)H-hydrate epimerase [Oerskovia sp. KBS0722]QDW62630.1 bifunctional ADP-dependent (S)-NAD(P)H-hydrate dehydratase/NAD(P)H-hydrate epimerase [Oerskovia sp. KBS0722]